MRTQSGCLPPGTTRRVRPPVDLDSNLRWRGLQIVDVVDGTMDDETGVIEFRATYVVGPGDVRVLHERSRFIREHGRWYYLDVDEQTGSCV